MRGSAPKQNRAERPIRRVDPNSIEREDGGRRGRVG